MDSIKLVRGTYEISDNSPLLGKGTYAIVRKAKCTATNAAVALKNFRRSGGAHLQSAITEKKILCKLDLHPNILQLVDSGYTHKQIYLAFECMECNIGEIIALCTAPFTDDTIRSIMAQLIAGAAHCHAVGVVHRDLKPCNLLVKAGVVKIADFGLACDNTNLGNESLTKEVVTLNYRPPELFLGAPNTAASIDMWSIGAIFTELISRKPLFRECTLEKHYCAICKFLGSPTLESYPEGAQLPHWTKFQLISREDDNPIRDRMSSTSRDLFENLIRFNPHQRFTAAEALSHPYLQNGLTIISEELIRRGADVERIRETPLNLENIQPAESISKRQKIA